jgi:hypothetical protein
VAEGRADGCKFPFIARRKISYDEQISFFRFPSMVRSEPSRESVETSSFHRIELLFQGSELG